MPTQLSKIAFIEEADLTKTKIFSVFQEGAEGASRQVLSIEANTAILENNREVITSKVYAIDVVGLYSQADKNQLYTWASDRTDLWITGYGLDGSILQAYGAISIVDGYADNASFRFRFQVESTGGYNATTGLHNSSMSYAKNGFALYNWQEGNVTSGVPAGWVESISTGTPVFNFSSAGIFEMEFDSSSSGGIVRDIYFPFPSKTVYFSFNAGSITNTTNPVLQMLTFDDSDVPTGGGASATIVPNSLNQISLTIPDDTIYIKLYISAGNEDDVELIKPVFALNSGTIYKGSDFNT